MPDVDREVIRRFLAPRSIAVVGASAQAESTSGRPLAVLRQHGYGGALYPVNPAHDEVGGLRAYASVRDLPEAVDLAVVTVPAAHVPGVLADCRDRGITAAYIISSGFDESAPGTTGRAIARELSDVVAASGVRVTGPNAEGIYNLADDIPLGFSPTLDYDRGLAARPRPGNVAVVSHSGGLGFGIFNQGLARGIDFSYVLSTGNEIDLGLLDYAEYLIEDERSQVIVLFVEGVDQPRRLRDLGLRAAALDKVVVVAKVGRFAEAQQAAISHTGHVTGPSELYSALFASGGIVEVGDIAELLDVVAALTRWRRAPGDRVGIVTGSGGAGAWLTDVCRAHGLRVPELPAAHQKRLLDFLPYYASARNPVDITAGSGGPPVVERTLDVVVDAAAVDVHVVIGSHVVADRAKETAVVLAGVADRSGRPVLAYSYTTPPPEVVTTFSRYGVPLYTSQTGVAQAIRALARPVAEPPTQARSGSPTGDPAAIPLPRSADGAGVLTEVEVKAWLRAGSLPVPAGELVRDPEAAAAAVARLGGPVAMKVQSPAVAHKADAGLLALNVGPPGAAATFDRLWARATDVLGGATPDGVLVERMVEPGFEMLVGVASHPDLGAFVVVGSGGKYTEVYDDAVPISAPATPGQVAAAVRRLRCAAAFEPGGTAATGTLDLAAFCELAAEVSRLAAEHGDRLAELDLNPVVVHAAGHGVDIVDGLAVLRDGPAPPAGRVARTA